jgi:hypothetical protein
MPKKKPFKLPKAFLNNLGEFTNGYYLITVNELGEFETFMSFPDNVTELAMLNFADIQSTTLQEMARQKALDDMQSSGESSEEEDGEFS